MSTDTLPERLQTARRGVAPGGRGPQPRSKRPSSPLGRAGLTLTLFQHMASGVRHLVMDTGAGFELKRNKTGALLTMLFSVVMTALFWLYMGVK